MNTYLPKLFDNTTLQTGKSIPGRININQAPRMVLMAIPNITADIVDQIIANRVLDPMNENEDQHYEIWPLTEGIVNLATMKKLQPFICAGGGRLSRPGARLLREGRSPWPSGGAARLYTTPHKAIILERYDSSVPAVSPWSRTSRRARDEFDPDEHRVVPKFKATGTVSF